MSDLEFQVVTDTYNRQYVVIRRRNYPQWLQVVAMFHSFDRAEAYALMENDMLADGEPARERNHTPPDVPEPSTAVHELMERLNDLATNAAAETVAPEPPASEWQRPDRPAPIKTLADEILATLPAMLEKYPKGPTVRQICAWVSADDKHVRPAMFDLEDQGRAIVMRRKDSKSYHLVPLDYEPPTEELTRRQSAVMVVLERNAGPDRMVSLSRRAICEEAEINKGGIEAVISALEQKGYIEETRRGEGACPTTFRVLRTTADPEKKPVPRKTGLSNQQRDVLDVMRGAAENGICALPKTEIANRAGVAIGSIHFIIYALEKKGYLEEAEPSGHDTPAAYRILEPAAAEVVA